MTDIYDQWADTIEDKAAAIKRAEAAEARAASLEKERDELRAKLISLEYIARVIASNVIDLKQIDAALDVHE